MSGFGSDGHGLIGQIRKERELLRDELLLRISAIQDRSQRLDIEYRSGLRGAILAMVDLWLLTVERGLMSFELPPAPLVQIELAVHRGVGLQTVLRRTMAGYALLGGRLLAAGTGLADRAELDDLLSAHARLSEPLVYRVTQAYEEARERALRSGEHGLTESVQRVLAGEASQLTDTSYKLDAWHTGLVVLGSEAGGLMRLLSERSEREGLVVAQNAESAWGWLSDSKPLTSSEVKCLVAVTEVGGGAVIVGEPAEGVEGFRRTHQEAELALGVWLKKPQPFLRYRDVALLAHTLADESLGRSLKAIYLAPLGDGRAHESVLRETLSVFLASGQSIKATAALLNADRRTIRSRLRSVEGLLGESILDRQVEIGLALRLAALEEEHAHQSWSDGSSGRRS